MQASLADYIKYHAFINFVENQCARFASNVLVRYQASTTDLTAFKTLTFEQVNRIATNLACEWAPQVQNIDSIALLADHSVEYFITLIAALKLRRVLMLLSPRNSEAANVNLLEKTNSKFMLASEKYQGMAKRCTEKTNGSFRVLGALDLDAMVQVPLNPDVDKILDRNYTEEDYEKIALIIHSSGTTSFPKPNSLSNRFLFYSACCRNIAIAETAPEQVDDANSVTLSSMPLFHLAGFFSFFSAMTVGSGNIFFKNLPPSPRQICAAIESQKVTSMVVPPFTLEQLVPYLKETNRYDLFANLKYVFFGGAPLNKATGNFYQEHGIKICSGYGTTEIGAGFMADASKSSKSWYNVRPMSVIKPYIIWEPYDEALGVYHLVIRGDSPTMATGVVNTPESTYATNDLFIEDPPNSGAYRYVGRKDDILIMENGEKTNPVPMEGALRACPIIRHATVIGEKRQCTAALVELDLEKAVEHTPSEMIELVQEAVRGANKDAPSHSTILPQMVYILPLNKHLPVTDKGTVNRKRAIQEYKEAVDKMYNSLSEEFASPATVPGRVHMSPDEVKRFLLQAAAEILQQDVSTLKADESLFDYGLNSLLAIQLRNRIASRFGQVSTNFIFENPSVSAMTQALMDANRPTTDTVQKHYEETQKILRDYIARADQDFGVATTTPDIAEDRQHVILLTGATGSLGAFMLRDMLKSDKVKKVYALVRGSSPEQLMDRLRKSFKDRRLDVGLLDLPGKLEVLPMNRCHEPNMGLDSAVYDRLKREITLVQACGWLVNFNQPVSHYEKECIRGLYQLLRLAYRPTNPVPVHHISSVSATAAMPLKQIPETVPPEDPRVAMPIGYGQSKYIVEHLFDYLTREKNFPCIIERMGQVVGDTENGVWNTSEQFPLLIVGGAGQMHKMPDLKMDIVDWLPVDYASASIFDIMLKTSKKPTKDFVNQVFHIVNPNKVTWKDVLDAMKQCGMQFDVISPTEWVKELAKHQENPAYRLMGFFEANYSESGLAMPEYLTENTVKTTPVLAESPAFNANLMSKQLKYWESVGFYNPSQ